MTIYVFRVWLQPNPLLGFEPDEEVWRDIEINGSHTLAAFHEAIFDAFKRWDSHAYEFITRDKEGIALRVTSVHTSTTAGELATDGRREIGRFIDRAVPDDAAAEAKAIQRPSEEPPTEGNAADTTVEELDPRTTGRALLHVRYGGRLGTLHRPSGSP